MRTLDPMEALPWLTHAAGDASLMFALGAIALLEQGLKSATD
jgi:hypothetical protein